MKIRDGLLALSGLGMAATANAAPRLPESVILTAVLSGAEEVPGPGDPDGSGNFQGTLKRDSGELCYRIDVSGIDRASAVRLHVGRRGQNDKALAELALPDADGQPNRCTVLPRRLVKHLMMVPEVYYINVYNVEFQQGALRGQLAR